MSLRKRAVLARELSQRVREENPAIAVAESDLCVILALNVLRLRNQRGMTQRDLARAMGVSQPRVAEIEGARTSARIGTVAKLAAVFGVEPWTLLKRREKRTTKGSAEATDRSVTSASA